MEELQHALLSPSSAHRWLNCTAAPRLEAGTSDDSSSVYAEEGTLAHAICAMKLKLILKQPTDKEEAEVAELAKYHTGEMEEYTDTYVAIVMDKYRAALKRTRDAKLLIEQRLDFTDYIPESFGTGDAIIIADGMIEVVDFKYGKGVKVDAYENPQMMIYALGACAKFSFDYRIEDVRMTIVQPRIDNLSEYELHITDLYDWAKNTLIPAANEAYSGKGKQKPGEWCQFCKVKARCRATMELATQTVEKHQDATLISKSEMEEVLPLLPVIKSWLSAVEEYALNRALGGTNYKGFKLVEGRSVRRITDQEEVKHILSSAGYLEEDYLKPEELKGISDLEKIVGKKRFTELCGDFIIKPQGKPTLVPDTDKRAAFNSAADDFKDI